ncbi:adenylosuccinate synthetase [Nonomuraea sp. LPB2021202275-12-8]|uniref:adenylosuccinate synthetase n=1 Tax=Nonomuraea sp. LPB2021202275-12-8 TaxID=3120159 RepID=UPI00300C7D1E
MTEHVIVADLGYGDAGKGSVVDWLCASRPVEAVVRFNGGAQAAHNVVLPDGRRHTFAQFGSGTLRGVPTHLSRYVVVDPLALSAEAAHLSSIGVPDPYGLLSVDREALLATPYHVEAGRQRELARGADRHGSCGMGVGETMAFALASPELAPRVGDCARPRALAGKLAAVREALGAAGPPVEDCVAAYGAFASRVALTDDGHLPGLLGRGPVVFEGAQGVLLDERHGFHPYTTWSTTTFGNALDLLQGAGAVRTGVLRTYTPRHGPGPLVTEDPALELPEPHNGAGPWQGPFRLGHFDAVAHRYALEAAGGCDGLVLTHLDAPVSRMCVAYAGGPPAVLEAHLDEGRALERQGALAARLMRERPVYGAAVTDWPSAVSEALGVPVVAGSWGPTARDKKALARAS